MSNIYALEPHTNGKVILHTTSGDIEIELWGKEAPRATRNFVQLCLEGYYDNTIFHRIVPDFLVQGGDPTGTGQGGESVYEDGFPNEFHSRLRFNRRGLVGVANNGQDDNGSQFFITLDRADELTRRHTLFGRVAGETLFNVMKMTELELDANERPRYPPKIKRTEVVVNPFDDILPRITERERLHAIELEKKRAQEEAKKKKKPQKKQLNLLSFGEEAAELEPPVEKGKKMKSAYDFIENAAEPSAEFMEELKKPVKQSAKFEEMREKAKAKEEERKKAREEQAKRQKELEEERRRKQMEQAPPETRQDAIEKMKQDIRDLSKPLVPEPVKKKEKKKSLVELEREKFGAQKRKKAKKMDDSDVFNSLMSFQKKLSNAQEEEEEAPKKEQPPCKIHDIPGCESCRDTTLDIEEEIDDSGWISHKLVFEKDLKGKDLMNRKDTLDSYVVIDPRSREAQAKQEEFDQSRARKRDYDDRESSSYKSYDDRGSGSRRRDYNDRRSGRDYDDKRSKRDYEDKGSRRDYEDKGSRRDYEDKGSRRDYEDKGSRRDNDRYSRRRSRSRSRDRQERR